jgi:pimeloyl-ACP methyl ester carboxylesterase
VDEIVACWRRITAPVLLVVSEHLDTWRQFTQTAEYSARRGGRPPVARDGPGAGHMMHHDRPQDVAALIEEFMR